MFDKVKEFIDNKDITGLATFMKNNRLVIKNGRIVGIDADKLYEKYNMMQHLRKILLNSLYGSLLNPHMRFFDARIGQSVTLSGKSISKFMAAKVNEIITGDYNHKGKSIIAGDTDSVYFTASNNEDIDFSKMNKEEIIELYDEIGKLINGQFSIFCKSAFNIPEDECRIAAAREVVAISGLFIRKKRYALMVVDNEGERQDIDGKSGKIKAMGLDLKRADTLEVVQDFLEDVLRMVLERKSTDEVNRFIQDFRSSFRDLNPWQRGTPKKVNNITVFLNRMRKGSVEYTNREQLKKSLINSLITMEDTRLIATTRRRITSLEKVGLPGHVRASINYNKLRSLNKDLYSMEISDGQKIIVCKLKPSNIYNMTSIAYPYDEKNLPEWFTALPFDTVGMEESQIDGKLENILLVLKWNMLDTRLNNNFNAIFG